MKITSIALLLLCSIAAAAQTPGEALAVVNGRKITASDLSPTAQEAVTKLPAVIADVRKQLLSQRLGSMLLEIEARSRKTTVDSLLKLQTAKIKDPTAAEIKAVYDANQSQIAGRPLDEVRKQIVSFIRRGPEEKAISEFVDTLAAKYKVVFGKDVNASDLKPADVLFTVSGRSFTAGEFDEGSKLTLYGIRADFYDEMNAEIEQAVFNALITEEAKSLKLEPGDLIAREITAKMKDYSDAERTGLQESLRSRLYSKYNAKILLEEPAAPVQPISADDDPSQGPASAPVTVVMFSDFQCSACAAVHPVLKHVLAGYGDKVRLVVRDFPLESIHDNAFNAAKAAAAAHAQGKFFEYTELLYARQDALDTASLKRYAAELGLNVKQFELDFNSEKTAAEVRKDMSDGESYGVNSTPTIFVNGVSARTFSAAGFRKAIDRALKK